MAPEVGFRSSWTFTHQQEAWHYGVTLSIAPPWAIVLHSVAVRPQRTHDLGARSRSEDPLDFQGVSEGLGKSLTILNLGSMARLSISLLRSIATVE